MRRLAAFTLLLLATDPAHGAENALATVRLSSDVATQGGGSRLVLYERAATRFSVFNADGARLASFVVPIGLEDGGVLSAARDDAALVCGSIPAGGAGCVSVDLDAGAIRARFEPPNWPAKPFAARDGWLFSERGSGHRSIRLIGDDGRTRAMLPVPDDIAARTAAIHPDASALRMVQRGEETWAIPVGLYEVWRIAPGAPVRFEVPPCLAVSGHFLEGEAMITRLRSQFSRSDAKTRAQLESMLPPAGEKGNYSGYFAAVLQTIVAGDRLFVMLETAPVGAETAFRLDVWRLPTFEWLGSTSFTARRSTLLLAGEDGAWVRQHHDLVWIPVPRPRSPDPCAPATD